MLAMTSKKIKTHFNCADIEKLTQRYVDGKLNEQENRLFEEHLEYCLPCDKKIQFELKLKKIIHEKGKEAVSAVEVRKHLQGFFDHLT